MREIRTTSHGAEREKTLSNRALVRGSRLFLGMSAICQYDVDGPTELADEPCLVTASHTTGLDIPLTIDAIGSRVRQEFVVADQSTHASPRGSLSDLPSYVTNRLFHTSFVPVPWKWSEGTKVPAEFDPAQADRIARELQFGKNVIIAAHNPLGVSEAGEATRPKPGVMAAYVAACSNLPVVPVAIDYYPVERHQKSRITNTAGPSNRNATYFADRKYAAVVRVGDAYSMESETHPDVIRELYEKRYESGALDYTETLQLRRELHNLRQDGATILSRVEALRKNPTCNPVIDASYTTTK